MADEKWSEFNLILGSNVAVDDLFAITDVSAVESKSIKYSELLTILASVATTQTLLNKTLIDAIINNPDVTWSTKTLPNGPEYINLVSSRPTTTTISIDADYVKVIDSAAFKTRNADNVNVTINSASSGVNGLDTGSYSAATHYYSFIIMKTDLSDPTIAGLQSLSPTAPTMPAGYSYKQLVHGIRCNTITPVVFRPFTQKDDKISFDQVTALSGGVSTVYLDIDISAAIPLRVKSIGGTIDGFAGAISEHYIASEATNETGARVLQHTLGNRLSAPFDGLPITTPQSMAYKKAATSGNTTLLISSYTMAL